MGRETPTGAMNEGSRYIRNLASTSFISELTYCFYYEEDPEHAWKTVRQPTT